jgi:hypothetical protein
VGSHRRSRDLYIAVRWLKGADACEIQTALKEAQVASAEITRDCLSTRSAGVRVSQLSLVALMGPTLPLSAQSAAVVEEGYPSGVRL